jgi:hypothetical protein
LVAAFFGMRDRDLGGWAGAIIALILGIATFIAFGAGDRHVAGPGWRVPLLGGSHRYRWRNSGEFMMVELH